jgi:hypothetical protein
VSHLYNLRGSLGSIRNTGRYLPKLNPEKSILANGVSLNRMVNPAIYADSDDRSYQGFKISKYVQSYLAGAQYRFNRRFNLESLVTRLLYACVQNDPRDSKWIRAAESAC